MKFSPSDSESHRSFYIYIYPRFDRFAIIIGTRFYYRNLSLCLFVVSLDKLVG